MAVTFALTVASLLIVLYFQARRSAREIRRNRGEDVCGAPFSGRADGRVIRSGRKFNR